MSRKARCKGALRSNCEVMDDAGAPVHQCALLDDMWCNVVDDLASTGTLCSECRGGHGTLCCGRRGEHRYLMWWMTWLLAPGLTLCTWNDDAASTQRYTIMRRMTWRAPLHYVVDDVASVGQYVMDDVVRTGTLYAGVRMMMWRAPVHYVMRWRNTRRAPDGIQCGG
jgi:hypothetical protein